METEDKESIINQKLQKQAQTVKKFNPYWHNSEFLELNVSRKEMI